uniref:Uncharacterized protein n=1 Tax=viral metagenome TaxID=1070528 RepID=A0A6M3KK49_9ZZZZ
MAGLNTVSTNPWAYWLEDFPQAAYRASIPQQGAPAFQDYWAGQYGRVSNDYQGELARMAQMGRPPTLGFGDYLNTYNFNKQYDLLTPSQRGVYRPNQLSWRA